MHIIRTSASPSTLPGTLNFRHSPRSPLCRVLLRLAMAAATVVAGLGGAGIASAQLVTRSAPAEPGPTLPAQPIGPNDLLAISVYGAPEFSRTLRVSEEGLI